MRNLGCVVPRSKEATPHPNPVASQARHESVALYEETASAFAWLRRDKPRYVVPDRGDKGRLDREGGASRQLGRLRRAPVQANPQPGFQECGDGPVQIEPADR